MSDEQRIAELEAQIIKLERKVYRVPFDDNCENRETWAAYAADLDMLRMDAEQQLAKATAEIENQKVIEGVADSYAAVLEADNAAWVNSLQDHWIEICDVGEACLFCEAMVTYKDEITQLQPQCNHKSDCILAAEHHGNQLLERLEAADALQKQVERVLTGRKYGGPSAEQYEELQRLSVVYDKVKEPKP